MSDTTNTITAAGAASDVIPQSWKDDPALLQKLIAGLALADSTRPTGLLDVMNSAVKTSGNLLDSGTGTPAPPVDDPSTPLFINSNANATSYYQIKDGWGIQKQGSKIHTFNYEVSPNNGLVDRVFGDALNILATAVTAAFTAADVVKAENDLKAYLPVSEADDEAKIQARKDIVDIIDTETGPTREKLAHLIHTAYTYIVETKPDDLVSYVSLADKALMTLSTDVKLLLGMRSNIPGVALAMVVETVATGSAAALKRRSIKPLVETNTVEKPSKIAQMKDLYTKKIYVSLKPKVQLEAEMDAAQIYPAPGETWAVQLLGQASNMEQLRGLDFATIEKAVESAPAIDQEKIYEMFAGLRGGGESSDVRRNLVQGGVDIKLAFELEKKAKENQDNPEDTPEKGIWSDLNSLLKDKDNEHRKGLVDKIIKAYDKTKDDKKKKAQADKKKATTTQTSTETPPETDDSNAASDKETTPTAAEKEKKAKEALTEMAQATGFDPSYLINGFAGAAGPAMLAIEIGKVVESIANANAKQLKEDIAETNEAREQALSEAETLLEKMKGSTGADLKDQQAELQNILKSVKRPANFGASRIRGMASIQNDLEGMSTRFGATDMNTLKPYASYQQLVAGANGGKALKSVALFSERDEPILTASRTLVQTPSSVTMTSPDLPFRTTTHRTTSEKEMNSFLKSTESSGLGTASKINQKKSRSTKEAMNFAIVVAEKRSTSANVSEEEKTASNSQERNANEEMSRMGTEAMISEFTFMPMKSFFLEERGLRLTNFAFNHFQYIADTKSAKKFIKTFGSHIPFGTQTMGGVFVRTMKISTTQERTVSELYEAAANKLASANRDAAVGKDTSGIHVDAFGLGGGANTSGANSSGSGAESTNNASSAGGSGTQKASNMASFESNVVCFGPKAVTADGLYQQLMKNNATWTIIDRGDTSSYLPVWELIEFTYGKEQFKKQIDILKGTWNKMALKNSRPQDVDLLSDVMDGDPKASVLQIVALLSTCLIPESGSEYNIDLANEFEMVMYKAYDLRGIEKPRTLKEFISRGFNKGNDSSDFVVLETEGNKFSIVETEAYEDANYIYSELEFSELEHFGPPPSDGDSTTFYPYDKAKQGIVARGKYVNGHLLEACVSGATQSQIDLQFFGKLFDYYSGRQNDAALRAQLYKKDIESGMCCLHYVAAFGDEVLIEKVLDKYDENSVETLVDADGNNALRYMEARPELFSFLKELKPEEEVVETVEEETPTQEAPKTMKEKIVDIFEDRDDSLMNAQKATRSNLKSRNDRRNRLADNAVDYHLEKLNEILDRIQRYDTSDSLLIQYALDEVGKARKKAASEETRFKNYTLRWENEYCQYIHRKAKETFTKIEDDIKIV